MFNCFEESNQTRIVLQDIDPRALSLLLDYVYTAEIQVNEDNVQVESTDADSDYLVSHFSISISK